MRPVVSSVRGGGLPPRPGALELASASFARLLRVAHVLARHGLTRLLGRRLARWPRLAAKLPPWDVAPPERLRLVLEELGGTFVKFGQMLALQPDIVSLETCNALFHLLDRIEPFPYAELEEIVRKELGARPSEVFDAVEITPLATASVGQVHVARLAGRKLALKVRRPNVGEEFGNDIRLMTAFMRLVRLLRLRSLYWLLEPMGEFAQWTEEELDFRHEARYQERLHEISRGSAIQKVPAVLGAYSTPRVLTSEFLEGVTLLAYLRAVEAADPEAAARLEPEGFDRSRFAANIIENFLGDAFGSGIYHADLHPANLIILPGNAVGYIDFGITGVISPHARRHLVRMTLALAEGDMSAFSRAFLPVTSYGPESDLAAFRSGLETLARGWYEDYEPGSRRQKLRVGFTRIMGEMLTLSRRTGILPERDIVKYIRSAIAIDGLISRFAPEIDVGAYLAETCGSFVRSRAAAETLDPEHWLAFSRAALPLLEEGPRGLSRWLDRLADREASRRRPAAAPGLEARLRAAQLALAVLMTTLLMTLSGGEADLGVNLWTSQLVFLLAAGATLIHTLARLPR